MLLIQQSEATAAYRTIPISLVQTDGITPATAEDGGQPQISKNGGAFANTGATLAVVGNGLYTVVLADTEVNTLGWVVMRYKSGTTAEAKVLCQIVPWDPMSAINLGLSYLDASVASRSSHSSADVLTQINAALNTAISEPSPGAPPTTPNIREALITVYEMAVNLLLCASTYAKFHNSSGTELFKATLSQASGVLTRSKLVAP